MTKASAKMTTNKIIRLSPSPTNFGELADDIIPEMFSGELPTQHTHSYYENDDLGLYIGTWASTAMVEAGGPYSCDEFMWLLEGTVDVKNNNTGTIETVKAGEAFVIPKGYDCQWRQSGYVRKFYVISAHPDEIIPSKPTFESILKPTTTIKEGDTNHSVNDHFPWLNAKIHSQKTQACYQDSQNRFLVGTWESDPFESDLLPFPVNEFVYLQSGRLLITDEHQVKHIFNPGDAFFIPQGTICRWHAFDSIRIFYTIIKNNER